MLRVVLGRRKETKVSIERQSGARIKLLPPTAGKSETDHWTCRVTGGHEETQIAANIIRQLLDNAEVCA